MKLLVGEGVPRKFKSSLPGHDCRTVPEEGLAGKKKGELLVLAEKSGSEVFLRLDRGLEYQQNLQGRNVAIMLIRVQSNRLTDRLPCSSEVLRVPGSIRPGEITRIG
jgi:hypothetical protein